MKEIHEYIDSVVSQDITPAEAAEGILEFKLGRLFDPETIHRESPVIRRLAGRQKGMSAFELPKKRRRWDPKAGKWIS